MSAFQETKMWFVVNLSLSKDALHISVGLAVFLIAAALFRSRLRDVRPLAAVLFVAVAGEAWDLTETWMAGEVLRWDMSWEDVWVTTLWPAILFALARWTKLLRP